MELGAPALSSSGFLGRASAPAWPGAASIPPSGRFGVHAGRSPWAGRDRRGTPKGAGAAGWRPPNETSTSAAGSRWIDFPAVRRTRRPGTFWKGGRRTRSADGSGPGSAKRPRAAGLRSVCPGGRARPGRLSPRRPRVEGPCWLGVYVTPCPAALRGSCQDGPKFAEETIGIRKVQEDFPGSPSWGLPPWELLQKSTLGLVAGWGCREPSSAAFALPAVARYPSMKLRPIQRGQR